MYIKRNKISISFIIFRIITANDTQYNGFIKEDYSIFLIILLRVIKILNIKWHVYILEHKLGFFCMDSLCHCSILPNQRILVIGNSVEHMISEQLASSSSILIFFFWVRWSEITSQTDKCKESVSVASFHLPQIFNILFHFEMKEK